jgi:diaminopimelate epimerase
MELQFTKMHGCGNDFAVFDDAENRYSWEQLSTLAEKLCDRRFSIGGDGIIAVGHAALPGDSWPAAADYEMRYINADGSRAEMCGNGIRCVGKYVADVLGDNRDHIRVMTGNGVLPIELHRIDGTVATITVGMGVPKLAAAEVPTTLSANGSVIDMPLTIDGDTLQLTAVSMGNPHAVSFVDRIEERHVHQLGPQVEVHPDFPRKTNVEFVEVLGPTHLRMRVWERGVGETWACGTGACATVVAAVLNGHSQPGTDVVVSLNGGDLTISWPGEGQPVTMTGPAEIVFSGAVEV